MPMGLVGVMIAAIFAAAMSAIGAELNALSTATLVDFYRRWLKPEATDRHYLLVSRAATAGWALVACTVALYAARLGSLIEVVNRFGSFFYGSLLGVFVLAIGTKRATGTGAFVGLDHRMCAVAFVAFTYPTVSFLWHNVVGVSGRDRRRLDCVPGRALLSRWPSFSSAKPRFENLPHRPLSRRRHRPRSHSTPPLHVLDAVQQPGGFRLAYQRSDWGMAHYDHHGRVALDDFSRRCADSTRSCSAPSAGRRGCPITSRSRR